MSVTDVLSGIKGKVLDATHFELLKHAYELQDENVKQLKTSNELLRQKIEKLEEENETLRGMVRQLQQQIRESRSASGPPGLSEVARALLEQLVTEDTTEFNSDQVSSVLPYSKIQVEAALTELREAGMIHQSAISLFGQGVDYHLTGYGQQYVVNAGIGKDHPGRAGIGPKP